MNRAERAQLARLVVSRVRGLAELDEATGRYSISPTQLNAIVAEYDRPTAGD